MLKKILWSKYLIFLVGLSFNFIVYSLLYILGLLFAFLLTVGIFGICNFLFILARNAR